MMGIVQEAARRVLGEDLTNLEGDVTRLKETAAQQAGENLALRENITMLELALENMDWRLLTTQAEQEFSRPGLMLICDLARIMYLKNPIIKRGVDVQKLYVWAQGINIRAKRPEINDVVQAFLDDPKNRAELTGHQARGDKEKDLQLESNIFFVFFPNPVAGRVRVRSIPVNEIQEIICNPEDAKEPWFYKRVWSQRALDGSTITQTAYYADWRYQPKSRLSNLSAAQLNGRIIWDTPVYHVAVNRLGRWGVSEVYAALDWAKAYKSFLENLASVWQALSRWAHKLTTKGGQRGVAAAKTKLQSTLTTSAGETNPPPVTGSTFIQREGVDLQPFRTAGATMSAEDGRRLMLMAAAVMGFPETFYGDVSVGTLATAKSLDRPTELKVIDRQTLWADIHLAIFNYVILWAVKASQGPLRGLGRVVKEDDGDQYIERIVWGQVEDPKTKEMVELDPTVDVDFPPVIEEDVPALMTAMGETVPAGVFTKPVVARFIANLLGLPDVDALIDEMFPEGWEDEETAGDGETPPAPSDEMMAEALRQLKEALVQLKESE